MGFDARVHGVVSTSATHTLAGAPNIEAAALCRAHCLCDSRRGFITVQAGCVLANRARPEHARCSSVHYGQNHWHRFFSAHFFAYPKIPYDDWLVCVCLQHH